MSRWFRLYADAVRNPKVARLSDKEFRLWIRLLSVAAENDGLLPCLDDLKHVLMMRLDHLSTGVERLIKGGLIDVLEAGYSPHNWNKFQYKSDTSTERVRKHREKGNVSVTPPETEADTDTETEQKDATHPVQPRIEKQPIAAAVGAWNETAAASGWPLVTKTSPTRQAAIRARLREEGIDGWTGALRRAAASPYLSGAQPPHWFNFDWLLKPNNFAKVAEGNYDNRIGSNGNGTDQHGSRTGYGRTVDAALEFVEEIERERQGGHSR